MRRVMISSDSFSHLFIKHSYVIVVMSETGSTKLNGEEISG